MKKDALENGTESREFATEDMENLVGGIDCDTNIDVKILPQYSIKTGLKSGQSVVGGIDLGIEKRNYFKI